MNQAIRHADECVSQIENINGPHKMNGKKISIIMPIYNREGFISEALSAIAAQSFTDWELIVVDDGSTDGSRRLIEAFRPPGGQKVQLLTQPNFGAYEARNRGLDLASGDFIAFYDSDDLWGEDHLADGFAAMEQYPEVDWIFCPTRVVEFETGREILSNTFVDEKGNRSKFFDLHFRRDGDVCVIDDPRMLTYMIRYGVTCSLQCSLIRRRVFYEYRFDGRYRNGQDRFLIKHAMNSGFSFAFSEKVSGEYRVHGSNSSTVSLNCNLEKKISIYRKLIAQYKRFLVETKLSSAESRAMRRRLNTECFWHLGYSLYLQNGQEVRGVALLRRGLRYWPWKVGQWRCYLFARARLSANRFRKAIEMRWSHPTKVYSKEFYNRVEERTKTSARRCVPILNDLFRPTCVVDVGCGRGFWLNEFLACGVDDIQGIEGHHLQPTDAVIPPQALLCHDLSKPLQPSRKFDLALCLEVAEHLPERSADALVRLLVGLAPVIVFSAAIPGQGGVNHINERWPWYWREKFSAAGYIRFDPLRPRFWRDPEIAEYYQQNMVVYVRRDEEHRWTDRLGNPTAGDELALVSERILKKLVEK